MSRLSRVHRAHVVAHDGYGAAPRQEPAHKERRNPVLRAGDDCRAAAERGEGFADYRLRFLDGHKRGTAGRFAA